MKKKSTKTILLVAVLLGSPAAALVLWEAPPFETLLGSLAVLLKALGGWLILSAGVFLMTWVVFNVIFAFGRWIWERFYRTPTL